MTENNYSHWPTQPVAVIGDASTPPRIVSDVSDETKMTELLDDTSIPPKPDAVSPVAAKPDSAVATAFKALATSLGIKL